MFVFQWDQEDWKQPMAVMAYALIGIAGSVYVLLNTGDPIAFLGGLADVGGALFLLALVTEGVIWNMVMALGKMREARDSARAEGHAAGREEGRAEGFEEGRAAMIRALREAGIPEDDIRRAGVLREARGNGAEWG